MAEFINRNDNLNQGREKLNEAIGQANKSEKDSAEALINAVNAMDISETTREEMIAIIREQTQNGDLAPEIAQARGGKQTLGERLNSTDQQLAQIAVNINSFGVVGDSINGDKETFQKAIDSGYPEIYFPDGEYYPIDVEITKPIRFVGHNKTSVVFKLLDKDDKGMFKNTEHINGFSMKNITIDEQGVNNGNREKLMEFINVFPLDFEDCIFTEMGNGLRFNVSGVFAGKNISHKPRFMRCHFDFSDELPNIEGLGSTLDFNTAMNDGVIEYCVFTNLKANGIRVYPSGTVPNQLAPTNWKISNNIFKNISRYDPEVDGDGVYTGTALYYRGDDLEFENNKVINVKRQPIDVQGINDQQVTAKNIKITGNYLRNDNGFSDYRQDAMLLFRNADVVLLNNTIVCDHSNTIGCGVTHKWGGSITAIGNKVFTPYRDGFDIWVAENEALPATVSEVIITDNYIESGATDSFSAIRIGLSEGKYIGRVIISNNVTRRSVLRIYKSFDGSGDIRRLVGMGNVSTEGSDFWFDEEHKSRVWRHTVISNNDFDSNDPFKSERLRLEGRMEIVGSDNHLKLPLNNGLLSASSSNMGRFMIVDVNNEQRLHVCLKDSEGNYTWKRIDV